MRKPEVMTDTTGEVNLTVRNGMPNASRRRYLLAHLVVRLVVIINIAHLGLSFYQPYFRATNRLLRGTDDSWSMLSLLILPMYCAIESFWMRRAEPSQRKALLIDWAFVTLWVVIWIGFLFYSFWKYAGSI